MNLIESSSAVKRSNDSRVLYVSNGMPFPIEPSCQLDSIQGCLIGTAVGDALGLPYEGLSPARAARLLGPPDRHRFLLRRGMVSDDTEHTCMVLQSLLTSGGDLSSFQREFAARLRWWLIALPAGTGLATAKAILKLWLGFRPPSSGVFSAGNGPAMRAAILGVMLTRDRVAEYVAACSTVSHSDPKAAWGAITVALAANLACEQRNVEPAEFLSLVSAQLATAPAIELIELVRTAVVGLKEFSSTFEFSQCIASRRGVSGYVYQTVPIAIHAWLRHQQDYRGAIEDVIRCGGDADTTAAIVGGIVGASVGLQGIPQEWQEGLRDWPVSIRHLKWLGEAAWSGSLNDGRRMQSIVRLPLQMARNLFFLAIVLGHGFRRLAPPY